ncbi:hypothetical protein EI94DRAFT_1799951 [Lactarius quietus]|nr:hypothetical protein EI94DRAFT_1799951 [Lactarius quietus]
MENADWHKLKLKLYPDTHPEDTDTHAANSNVKVQPSKKKCRLNADSQRVGHNHEGSVTLHQQPPLNREEGAHDVPPHLLHRQRGRDSDDESNGTLRFKVDDEDPDGEKNEDLVGLDDDKLQHSLQNEIVGWDDDQPTRSSQSRVPPHNRQDDDSDSSSDNLQTQTVAGHANASGFIDVGDDDEPNDKPDDEPGSPQADEDRPILTNDDDNDNGVNYFGNSTAQERNSCWPRTPICPPGSRQRNICINSQPKDFRMGYVPVDMQTDLFIEIAVESATNLNKLPYAARLQEDSILQKEVCDLFNARVSLYRTTIKRIATTLVLHGYGLAPDNQSMGATQVKELVHNDRFIFEPKVL